MAVPTETELARRRRAVDLKLLGLALGLFAATVLLQIRIDGERGRRALRMFDIMQPHGADARYIARQNFSLYLPRAQFLRHASMGHRNIVADMIWLKAAHYVSKQFAGGGRLEWLNKMYNVTVDLDPCWENAYWIGGMILASVARKPQEALALYEKGMRRMPESWKLPYEAGVTHLFFRGEEHSRAALRYLSIAKERPGCPANVKDVIVSLLRETGEIERAVRAAERNLEEFGPDSVMGKAARRILKELRSEMLVREWQKAVDAFKAAHGRPPRELGEAPTRLLLKDFYGRDLLYDPAGGKVASEGIRVLRTMEAVGVMNAALDTVKAKLNRPPVDTEEFVEEVRKIYVVRRSSTDRELIPMQLEKVMGKRLEIPPHPFADRGEKFRYLTETGEFELRPDRRPEALYDPEEM